MAAAGLSHNEASSGDAGGGATGRSERHLMQLADFTLAMRDVVATVNEHSKFKFKIRAGEVLNGI